MGAGGSAVRMLRWAATAIVVAGLLMVGVFLFGGADAGAGPGAAVAGVGRAIALAAAAALAAVGFIGCLAAAVAATRDGNRRARAALVVGVAVGVPLAAGAVLLTGLSVLLLGGLVLGWIVLGVAAALPTDPDPAARATRPGIPARLGLRWTAMLAAVAVLGATAVGVLHVLVWNPLAKVPGSPLAEIYATMAARGESPASAIGMVAAWASGWLALALVFLAVAAVGRRGILSRLDARRVARTALVAIAGIGVGVWGAGFSMGMSIADAFATSGGDAAWTGSLLIAAGLAAGIAAAVRIIPPQVRTDQPTSA